MASGTIKKNRVLLWSGHLTGTTATVTLSEPYTNYAFVMICWKAVGVYARTILGPTTESDFSDGLMVAANASGAVSNYASIEARMTSPTTFRILYEHRTASWGTDNAVTAIYGLL